jgi:HK97 family phage major capsid protein
MSKRLNELREERNRLVTQARGILTKAEAEKRDLSTEEQGQYDVLMTDQQRKGDDIKREERQVELERELASTEFKPVTDEKGDEVRTGPRESKEYRSAFAKLLMEGKNGIGPEEWRALQAGSDVDGGYLRAPMQMVDMLLKFVDNAVFMRGKATKYRVTSAAALGVPSLDTDLDDADWTAELATGNEDTSMKFGRRELHPKPLAKRIKISNKLLSSALMSVESLVNDRMGYKFGVTQEKAFLTGSGANQPLGVFTASSAGISTARDVSTGNAQTAITFDGLIEAKYSLKSQYMKVAEWLFHRDAVKMLAKLKDGDGQYIWQASRTADDPDMLLGRPVNMSEYAPNTFTTGLYVGMFADFSKYWIADAMDMQVQVLKELYAETNQTGYIGRLESDGMPVLEEAFARVKLA